LASESSMAGRSGAVTWPGRDAAGPSEIPLVGWKQILRRLWGEMGRDHITLLSAGLAYYTMLALFPGLIALLTLYGLLFDPVRVQQQITSFTNHLGGGAGQLLAKQLHSIATSSPQALGWGLVLSLLGALWTASTGMQNLLNAINIAYDEEESRNFIKVRGLALLLTLGAIVFIIITGALVAVLPAVLRHLGLGGLDQKLIFLLRWPLLALIFMFTLAVIFRVAPDRRPPGFRWITWGAIVATILWLAGSWGFSFYVQNFGNYNKTYGSLGAVIVLLLWFYVTAFVILLGAEINCEIERQAGRGPAVHGRVPTGEGGRLQERRDAGLAP
jgi:membrane protein